MSRAYVYLPNKQWMTLIIIMRLNFHSSHWSRRSLFRADDWSAIKNERRSKWINHRYLTLFLLLSYSDMKEFFTFEHFLILCTGKSQWMTQRHRHTRYAAYFCFPFSLVLISLFSFNYKSTKKFIQIMKLFLKNFSSCVTKRAAGEIFFTITNCSIRSSIGD